MSSIELMKLVTEIEKILDERGDLLDTYAREKIECRLIALRIALENDNKQDFRSLIKDAFEILSYLLIAITNVMNLWK